MVTFRPSIVPKHPDTMTELKIRAHKEDIEAYLVQENNKLQYKIKSRILTLVDDMYVRLHPISLMY